jgi:hypothetical protein
MRPEALLLRLLVAADLVFIGVHVVHVFTPYLRNPLNSLEQDRGYAEYFQYTKLYWLILLSAALAVRRRALIYLAWLAVFGYLLVDDAFSVHEQSGAALANSLELTPALGLRAADFGELLVMAIAASAMAALLALGYWRSAAAGRAPVRLLALLAGFAAAAVPVDMVHSVFRDAPLGDVLAVIEDGGEMLVVSLMLWVVAREVAAEPAAATSAA